MAETNKVAVELVADDTKGSATIKRFGAEVDAAFDRVKKKAMGLSDTLRRVGPDAHAAFDAAKTKVDGVSDALFLASKRFTILAAAATAATAAIYLALRPVVETGMAFEKTMAKVKGVMRATDQEVEALTETARKMGAETEWSASQAAEALTYLGMAGFGVGKSIAVLPGVLDLATAGNIELGRAADIASNALSAMRLDVSEMGRVNDVFIGTITRANTNMDLMADSFTYAAPTAKAYGYSIEQLSAMIGLLGNSGIKGSMAGTQLSRAFQKSEEVFKRLGMNGEGKNLIDALELVNQKGFTASEIMKIFGDEGGRAALVLKDSIPDYKQFVNELNNAGGEAKKLGDTMRNTTSMAVDELTSAIEDISIQSFTDSSGDMKAALIDLTKYIRDNNESFSDLLTIIITTAVELARFSATMADDVAQYVTKLREWFKANDDLIRQRIPEFVDDVTTAIKSALEVVINNPAIVEFGIVGLALFGRKGAVIAGLIGHMASGASTLGKALGLAASGAVSFGDVLSAELNDSMSLGFKNMKALVNEYDETQKKLSQAPKFYKITMPDVASDDGVKAVVKTYKSIGAEARVTTGEVTNAANAITGSHKAITESLSDLRAELSGDLAGHFRELRGEVTEYERQMKSVDDIVNRYAKSMKEAGATEQEISGYRTKAHGELQAIIKDQEELQKIIDKISKLPVMGDDYEGIADAVKGWPDKAEEALAYFEESGKKFGDAFVAGIADGFDGVWDSLRDELTGIGAEMIGAQIGDAISIPVKNAMMKIFSEDMAGKLGVVVSGVAGGVMGAGISAIVDGVFGGGESKYAAVYESQRKLAEEIRENTEATRENTRFKQTGETSSYSSGFFDLRTSADDARKTLRDQMKELKSPLGSFGDVNIGEMLDTASGLNAFINSLEGMTIDTGGWSDALAQFQRLSDTLRATGKEVPGGLDSIIATLEEFSADLNAIQKEILSSARDMWEGAGDTFRTESEIQKREIERSGKDLLMGLAESFKLEGVKLAPVWKEVFFGMQIPFDRMIDDDYLSSLSSLGSVQAISQQLLADLIPGTEAYNQAMETTLLIYETALLQEQKRAEETAAIYDDLDFYMKDLRGELTGVDKAIMDVNQKFNDYEAQIKNYTGAEVDLSDQRDEAIRLTRKLHEETGTLTETLADLAPAMESVQNMWNSAMDAFRTDAERQKQAYEETGKEALSSLVAAFDIDGIDMGQSVIEISSALMEISKGSAAYADALKMTSMLLETAALQERKRAEETATLYDDLDFYMKDLRGEFSEVDKAIMGVNQKFDDYETQLRNYGVTEANLSQERAEAIQLTRQLHEESAGLSDGLSELLTSMQEIVSSLSELQEDIAYRLSGMTGSEWALSQFDAIGKIFAENGKLTEKELEKAVGYITDWYNEEVKIKTDIISAWKEVSATINTLKNSIQSTVLSIRYSGLNLNLGTVKTESAKADYQKLFQAAKGGDKEAFDQYLSFTQTYLQTAQDAYKSSAAYQDIYARVMADLDSLNQYVQTEDYSKLIYDANQVIADESALTNDHLRAISDRLSMFQDGFQRMIAASTSGAGLPQYASGGVAWRPQIAQIGEDGPEAVIPLRNGSVPVILTGGGGTRESVQPLQINVQIGNETLESFIIKAQQNVTVKANRRGGNPGRIYR